MFVKGLVCSFDWTRDVCEKDGIGIRFIGVQIILLSSLIISYIVRATLPISIDYRVFKPLAKLASQASTLALLI